MLTLVADVEAYDRVVDCGRDTCELLSSLRESRRAMSWTKDENDIGRCEVGPVVLADGRRRMSEVRDSEALNDV